MLKDPDSDFSLLEEPIRSEIFSASRLESHALSLAQAQPIIANPKFGKSMDSRVRHNSLVLEKSYKALLKAVEEKRAITPAAEWLIDNFHIVRAQLKDIHEHLPPSFYKELPKLAEGPLAGYPRIYGIAWAFVAHTDSRFDPDLLKRFLKAYQTVQPLTIGELWAVSITIRVVLTENLRRLSARIVGSQIARKEADQLANEVLGLGETPSRPIHQIVASLGEKPFIAAFAVQLMQRLRFQDSNIDPILHWLEKQVMRDHLSADDIVSLEHTSQTAANATVRNIITSSRAMAVYNWQELFEDVSLVNDIFKKNPIYPQMDFSTRDRYRRALEELARHSKQSELNVAQIILQKSLEHNGSKSDLGYYLLSRGRRAIEKEIKFTPTLKIKFLRSYVHFATPSYLGVTLLLTLGILFLPVRHLWFESQNLTLTLIFAFLGIFLSSEMALAVVNRITIALLGPRHLPRLSLEQGVPESARTFVVVPTLFSQAKHIEEQVEQLEIHYLSNPEENLYFAVLSDFLDSSTETQPKDAQLLDLAERKITQLNQKYPRPADGHDRFYIFHRKRLFNKQEKKWMGWERKRGKLHEFNQLLLGAQSTSYAPLPGRKLSVPPNIRYVITLDADTRLPNSSALQLIGTLAHPLNNARIDHRFNRVVEGYGILQPRVTAVLASINDTTPFRTLSTGDAGIDPYASAVSDIYQDLFDEGSYTGKGIYDVQVFETVLKNRIPENTLLSHDLFEGGYARCGFLSDVEFFEDFPSHTEVASSRTHRWTRGDWQLLPWILGRGGNSLSALTRWKMIDNLRRSLIAPFAFLTIVLSLVFSAVTAWNWIALTLCALGISTIVSLVVELLPRNRQASLGVHLETVFQDFEKSFTRFLLSLALLPHQAWLAVDAITRALYRITISHTKMLEWTTAAQAQSMAQLSLKFFVVSFRGALLLTIVAGALIYCFDQPLLLASSPLLLLWILSPYIAQKASTPSKPKLIKPLQPEDIEFLQLTGRKIWRFFTTFVTKEDHYLPPDNFQETPNPVIAHRSSPTNFGLYLLSAFAAKDFGWIGHCELAERLDQTLHSMDSLPRYEGHFYNWYETVEARPLEPKYISAVDNGNLAGHLLAVAQGCLAETKKPISFQNFKSGLLQTTQILQNITSTFKGATTLNDLVQKFKESLLSLDHVGAYREFFSSQLVFQATQILTAAGSYFAADQSLAAKDAYEWSHCLLSDAHGAVQDFSKLFAWTLTEIDAQSLTPEGQEKLSQIKEKFILSLSLAELPHHCEVLLLDLAELRKYIPDPSADLFSVIDTLEKNLDKTILNAHRLTQKYYKLFDLCHKIFNEMDFKLLYDPSCRLFSIGFRVADKALDNSYYDLLASEARLTSFIAIAKGDVSASHWLKLGRGFTHVNNGTVLISWSGSMFEYLMPSLVMSVPENSIMDQTCRLTVQRQIQYASERDIPWGISESAYNKRDQHLTYQYSNFGVPNLGLKKGLGADLVVAPYATILAAMYESAAAIQNLRELQKIGGAGIYGFFEAIDFTPSRLPEGQKFSVVRCYMAHHQGMSLVSIANIFKNGVMRERFHADPMVQAAELLLQERTPRNVGITHPSEESLQIEVVKEETEPISRQYHTVNRPVPTTQLLSNGDYSVMVTSSGSGFSRFRDMAITRWREDVTRDNWGQYFFIRDVKSKKVWSATYQPTCIEGEKYDVTYFEDRVRYNREDDKIASELEIFISPEDNAEIRGLKITNNSDQVREIEITSYAEVVLAPQNADVAHPAFSNLFVQTEYIHELQTLLATRRPRSAKESPVWAAHVMSVDRYAEGPAEYESDRSKFIGRARSVRNPISLKIPLSNTVGSVLDPVFSLRTKVRLEPGLTAQIHFSTIISSSREEILWLADKFRDKSTAERVSDLAWTQAQVKLHYLNIEPDEAHLFQRLATRLIYSDSSLRPSSDIIKRNSKDVTGLWAHGISGDFPILLVRIDDFEDRGIVRQLLKAHEYFATKGLVVDLVILNDKAHSYAQELQNSLAALVHSGNMNHTQQAKGKVFILRADALSPEDRLLIYISARVVLSSRQGNLSEQVKRMRMIVDRYSFAANKTPAHHRLGAPSLEAPALKFFNGFGGFTEDGREFVTVLRKTETTPAPWINVIANSYFGFQVSESGSGYTWAANSRENQITPWQNDPVCDPSGEAFYILDKDSGALWSPTALPIRVDGATYICAHGQGYSRFEHLSHGIQSELTQFVPIDLPVKISTLKLKNRSKTQRTLSISAYVEWVLGFSRATMAPTTITEYDESTGAIFASNSRSNEYGHRISFALFKEDADSLTGDRSEFLGRNGSFDAPGGVYRDTGFSGRVGAALDPCAALQKEITLSPNEEFEISFFLGQAEGRKQAQEIIEQLRTQNLKHLLADVKKHWDETLDKVQVQTPDQAMNLMLNRWLLYQTLVCRFWARAAFYQAGGAFGFRDQLQDVMALSISQPKLARAHILRAASRQFIEGDVQHWWHPPFGRGVRTHFSDDLLWLPYTVSHYLNITKDLSILDQQVSFLEGPLLRPDQEDSYYTPAISHNSSTLYDHCCRTLERSLATGAHGLPLIGAGDWNDGMNRVGHGGQGESVWLAWFLYKNLMQFAEVAISRGDVERAAVWRAHAIKLQEAVEKEAWDGEWYRRAYFDDGTPIGSASQDECRIDSLSQTWAIISGAGDAARSAQAMASVEKNLIRSQDDIILLFTPAFDKIKQDPGYIKGYLPGVRENGGQYTHAAVWCVIAYAMMGQNEKAHEVFSMINPIRHSDSVEKMERYKVEPYVLAADIYSQTPYTGRGGWTWYTGSSSWMYRAGIESILGFNIRGDEIHLKPCVPKEWKEFKIFYQYGSSRYEFAFTNTASASQKIWIDSVESQEKEKVVLTDDGKNHLVRVQI